MKTIFLKADGQHLDDAWGLKLDEAMLAIVHAYASWRGRAPAELWPDRRHTPRDPVPEAPEDGQTPAGSLGGKPSDDAELDPISCGHAEAVPKEAGAGPAAAQEPTKEWYVPVTRAVVSHLHEEEPPVLSRHLMLALSGRPPIDLITFVRSVIERMTGVPGPVREDLETWLWHTSLLDLCHRWPYLFNFFITAQLPHFRAGPAGADGTFVLAMGGRRDDHPAMHGKRFPGENEQYRQARNELLRAELELRQRMEEVAALRRRLPTGGAVPEDYVFEEGAADLADRETVRTVQLTELFAPAQDTLVFYNFMYGPKMANPCPMCSSFLDGLNGNARQVQLRAGLAVVARSPLQRIREFAHRRGWRNLRLLSSEKNNYNRDYHGEEPDGSQNPMLNVFVRRDGRVHHFWASELVFTPSVPGMNQRHLDTMWPLWNVLDLTPEGRGANFYPPLE